VAAGYKPVLWFIKGKRCKSDRLLKDTVISSPEKGLHEWQQSAVEAEHFIRRLTDPGDLVADFLCGSGTVPLASKRLGRRWFACDSVRDNVLTARKRLSAIQA
jgi:DNA modification methylase